MITDFFGVEPDGRLAVKAKITLASGQQLPMRPLSLEKLFALMGLGLPSFDGVDVGAMEPMEFMALFSAQLAPAVSIAIDADASELAPEDLPAVVLWYMGEHDWKRIYSEIMAPDGEPAPPSETADAVLDLMFAIEIATEGARPVESQLKMKPEAWLSTLEAMERRAQKRKAAGSPDAPGSRSLHAKKISLDQLFAMLPGGEVVDVKTEQPGEGGH